VGAFDGGVISSDAGALLLGATDKAIGLARRYAACFSDGRKQELIEHRLETLVGPRVFGIALGYEDLNDHGELQHDPVMPVLAGKLEAHQRKACAPAGGQVDAVAPGARARGRRCLRAGALPQDRPMMPYSVAISVMLCADNASRAAGG
jgi:hypothetical protein